MITVMLLVNVNREKRRELLLSIRGMAPEDQPGFAGLKILQAIDDPDLVCCLLRWETEEETRRYLASDLHRAMRGAVGSLGQHCEWHLLRHVASEALSPASLSRVGPSS